MELVEPDRSEWRIKACDGSGGLHLPLASPPTRLPSSHLLPYKFFSATVSRRS